MSKEPLTGAIPEAMIRFLKRHHVLTLATSDEQGLWCANCFYACDPQRGYLIFTSSPDTRHGAAMSANPHVAASVVLETRIVGRVQGIQIAGRVMPASEESRRLYLKRFPYTLLAELHLWQLEAEEMKLTDNTLGFGEKLRWKRSELEL